MQTYDCMHIKINNILYENYLQPCIRATSGAENRQEKNISVNHYIANTQHNRESKLYKSTNSILHFSPLLLTKSAIESQQKRRLRQTSDWVLFVICIQETESLFPFNHSLDIAYTFILFPSIIYDLKVVELFPLCWHYIIRPWVRLMGVCIQTCIAL